MWSFCSPFLLWGVLLALYFLASIIRFSSFIILLTRFSLITMFSRCLSQELSSISPERMKSLDFFYLLYYLCIFFFNFSFCFFSCLFFPRCVITASCYTQSFTGSFNCIPFLFQFFHRFYLSPQNLFRFFNISI